MKKQRNGEARRLTELTVMARDAMRANKDKLEMSEKILQLAELGRKLETEREKVQPFYESTSAPEAVAAKLDQTEEFKQNAMRTSAVGADGQMVGEWGHLQNFHKKFNKVLLDKLAIAEEKKRLMKENGDLRSILKQYLDGIAITEDVVDADNPLLIVNGRVNLVDRDRTVRRTGRPNNIGDATMVMRTAQVMHQYA